MFDISLFLLSLSRGYIKCEAWEKCSFESGRKLVLAHSHNDQGLFLLFLLSL